MSNNTSYVESFFKQESAGGILLMIAAVSAVIIANSPLEGYYNAWLNIPVAIQIGALQVAKPLLLWINDGLMAIFFLLVGLELKREVKEGELSKPSNIVFPAIGAVGGMVIPALIYFWFNKDDPFATRGWAIPAATDIAFALGILALLGSRVPVSLKIFLTSLAIFDDVGAIMIIAIFYTSEISFTALMVAAVCSGILLMMNLRGASALSRYLLVGIIMWFAMLKSGVHATLAGVLLAMFIPMKSRKEPDRSPLKSLEHDLHGAVAFMILPIFALANAGIDLEGMSMDQVLHPVPLGIALGLFVGKQIGIFGLCWLAIKAGFAKLPSGMNYTRLYGVSLLCGVGFTMSLFIGSLAFDIPGHTPDFDERLGIILGSIMSGTLGFFVLKWSLDNQKV